MLRALFGIAILGGLGFVGVRALESHHPKYGGPTVVHVRVPDPFGPTTEGGSQGAQIYLP